MKGAVLGVRDLRPSAKGRKPRGLQRNWTGSSCHLRSSPPLQRAARSLELWERGLWEGWGLAQPTACLQLLRRRYYPAIFRSACQV